MLETEKQYKEIPEGASLLRAEIDGFENDYYAYIWAITKHGKQSENVWSSNLYTIRDYDSSTELEELREEFREACEHYNIEIDLSSNNIWDWRAKKNV